MRNSFRRYRLTIHETIYEVNTQESRAFAKKPRDAAAVSPDSVHSDFGAL